MKPTYKTKSNLYRKVSGKKGLQGTPKYQYGGASRADSIAVLNNARSVLNYYNNKGTYTSNPGFTVASSYNVFPELESDRRSFGEFGDILVPTSSGGYTHLDPSKVPYYKPVDKNRFYQRESQNVILDTRAPMPLYDRRIRPTHLSSYTNTKKNDPLYKDAVDLYTYDPLSVTPWDMLNKNQRAERIKKYGYSGTPYKNKGDYILKTSDPKILEKQRILKKAGLYKGTVDGVWGKDSKDAWKKYEEGLSAEKTPTTTPTATTTTTTTTPSTPSTPTTTTTTSNPRSTTPLTPTTTAVKPPVVTKPAIYTAPTPVQKKTTPQPSTDTPWRFMLGNDSYQTFDEETAKMFAKDLGITNLQRGDNKNIDPATKKYRDYSSLVTPITTSTGTTGTITKYPKLKRMEYGGQIAKGSRLKKLYTAYKTRQ